MPPRDGCAWLLERRELPPSWLPDAGRDEWLPNPWQSKSDYQVASLPADDHAPRRNRRARCTDSRAPGNAELPLVAVCARPQLRAYAHANESTWGCFPAQSLVASLRDRVI